MFVCLSVYQSTYLSVYKVTFTCNYSYRIGPFEVESALIEHPAVAESAVVSSPDPVRGEVRRELMLSRLKLIAVHVLSRERLEESSCC